MTRAVLARLALAAACAVSIGAAQEWRVSPRPLLSLGEGVRAGEDFDLVARAVRLPDGGLAVANVGTRDLRLFDRTGRFRRTVGRSGEGPGEFRYPAWIGRWPGDSLAVWDANLGRLSIFDGGGTHGRTLRPPQLSGMFPEFVGVFADGSFVIASGTDAAGLARQPGLVRPAVSYLRYSRAGVLLDTLAVAAGDETFAHAQNTRTYYAGLPFGARTIAAVHGDRFYLADSGAGEIRTFDGRGRELERVAVRADERALTRADWRRLRELRIARLVRDDGSVHRLFDEAPMPDRYPAFDAFLIDADGLFWVRRFAFPGEPARWEVHDRNGAPRAAVRVPADLQVYEIGPDWLLAGSRGAYDVELVLLYGLTRGAPAAPRGR